MDEKHILQLTQNLIERFEFLGAAQFNLESEIAFLVHPITREPLEQEIIQAIETGFLGRIQYKRSHDNAVLIPVSMVSDPRDHEEWYSDWLINNNSDTERYYWKRLENFLSMELTRKYGASNAGTLVRSIDEATFSIMEKLANPARREFSYKGLVVGYVQSGKTANFTALIAKAADAGYKFIIVLAGIHNVLRRQTQVRLDRELTGVRDITGPDNYISLPGPVKSWNRLTTAHNDFVTANLGLFEIYCQLETPTIAVVKKNATILNRLIDYISQAPEALRDNLSVLIIDDEADQASVDTNANNPDTDPSRTNECIRNLLRQFSRKAYVGYTATPFANVLVDMTTEHDELHDDLYPRNFVVSLPEPANYFGTAMVFQGDLSERFVIQIPDESNTLVRHGEMTPYLAVAIKQFILCCAARNLRGDRTKPMSMLIHVSHRISEMTIITNIINNESTIHPGFIQSLRDRYNDPGHNGELRDEFRNIWVPFQDSSNTINQELNLINIIPPFEEIWEEIANVFPVLQVMELNSASEDRLDYTTGEEIKVIAIGGNQLSRGLTLEGLMISYYLRASRQYDTLLQMGRWFGYRQGYEDLTRIHTTEQIWDFFEHLALVESELRSQIYRYEELEMTPLQMAIAIRDHRTLSVTSTNKMGAAQLRQSSYSQSLNQTIWLPLDQPESLRANYNLGESFIRRINAEFEFTNSNIPGSYLATNVPGELVLEEFLNRYMFVDKITINGPGLDDESLLTYIHRRLFDASPELSRWNIVVIGNINPNYSGDPITYGGLDINRVGRSRKYTSVGYNIGVLTESAHLKIDLELTATSPYDGRSPQTPLLLLYLIAKESEASTSRDNPTQNQRVNLFRFVESEQIDVLGIAIVLPESAFEPNSYIGQ